jgi:hypothetical protein
MSKENFPERESRSFYELNNLEQHLIFEVIGKKKINQLIDPGLQSFKYAYFKMFVQCEAFTLHPEMFSR